MENSFWDTCLPYLGMNDDEQLICHQSTSQNPDEDLILFSQIKSYNLVSFDNSDFVERVPSTIQQPCTKKQEHIGHDDDSMNRFESSRHRGTRKGRRNPKSGTLDHVVAERRRRHELAQKFTALSATIPGLKKMDKASVLSGAINYVKQLQERIKELEEKANKKKSIESAILSAKRYSVEEEEEHDDDDDDVMVDVEARVLEREILIRIKCKKQDGIMLNIASFLENTHLTVTNSSVLPFANSTLGITIITLMREEYGITVHDLVKNLRREICSSYVRVHERAGV